MEESIIKLIAEAEQKASARKAQAQEQAAEIVAAAERRASEIVKASEESCKLYREKQLEVAEKCAVSEYESAIEACRADAASYAEGLLSHADTHVFDIVGRLTK